MTPEIRERLQHALDCTKHSGSALDGYVAVLKADVRALLATPAPLSDEPVALNGEQRDAIKWALNHLRLELRTGKYADILRGILAAPPATPSDKQEADQIRKMIERLRDRAESDEIAASEIDPLHYRPDEPESIAAGLEFSASERRECADMLENLAEVIADQGHRIASYMAELEARAPPAQSAEQDRIDAERYRWLRRRVVMVDYSDDVSIVITAFKEEGPSGEFLDDQIDTFIAKGARK